MYSVDTPEVVVLDRARADPQASARMERMMRRVRADRVTEVDDAGLAELIRERGWDRCGPRTGLHRMERHPALIFNTFRWLAPEEIAEITRRHPALGAHPLLLDGAWAFRDADRHLADAGCVCRSAWEVHCAYGCLHACDYCHVPPFYNIMLNLEELAERLREFGETIPWQKLYKFDNYTDTICLEPEYGASETMVRTFADWPGRYLLLYTKSDNVEHLLGLPHNGHTIISWSLSCETVASRIEKRTPPLEARIRAIERCQEAGYTVRVRISPICPVKGWREENRRMIERLLARTAPDVITIDAVGWMDAATMKEAMDTSLWDERYVAALDGPAAQSYRPGTKHLLPHELRAELLRFVIEEIKRRRPEQPVSICMETRQMWRELGPLMGMTPQDYVCCCGPTSVPGHPLLPGAQGLRDGPGEN